MAGQAQARQDVQAMHRIRSELVGQRTSKANHIRGLVGEYGIVAPKGIGQLRRALPCWLEDAENGLSEEPTRRHLPPRLQITLIDGEQVEPTSEKPGRVDEPPSSLSLLGSVVRIAHQGPMPMKRHL